MVRVSFILLFAGLAMQAHGSLVPATLTSGEYVNYSLSSGQENGAPSAAFVPNRHDSDHRNIPERQRSTTQLSQAPDMVIHVSLVPATHTVFLFLSNVYTLTGWRLPEPVSTDALQGIFKVLFQVIISPNAP